MAGQTIFMISRTYLNFLLDFCVKYQVDLCVEKTKLLSFATEDMAFSVDYQKTISPVNINGEKICFVDSAEHVGILRAVTGNLPNILKQIIAHKKKLGAVLHTGVAQGHHGNPAASLRVNQIYGLPVLLSGLGALLLNRSEKDIINQHHKNTLQNLMRLHAGTPPFVLAFLAGPLPGKALLHLSRGRPKLG